MKQPYIVGWGHTPFGKLDNMGEDPNVRGKTEIPHSLDFQALKAGATGVPEISITTHLVP